MSRTPLKESPLPRISSVHRCPRIPEVNVTSQVPLRVPRVALALLFIFIHPSLSESWLPASRAGRLPPAEVLRSE